MIKRILVAGVHDPNNLLVRYCEQNFLRVEHYPDISSRPIPVLDAVIIAQTAISHQLDATVKALYRAHDRPVYSQE